MFGNTPDLQTIACYRCGKPQEVSRRAKTITCRHCSKPLVVEDLKIAKYEAKRAIETVGTIVVEKKGSAITDRIVCNGLIARGTVRGTVTSGGPVKIGPEASLKGDVTAPTLAVGAGAVLDGHYEIGTKPPVNGEADLAEAG